MTGPNRVLQVTAPGIPFCGIDGRGLGAVPEHRRYAAGTTVMRFGWIPAWIPLAFLALGLSGCNLGQELGLSYIPPVLSVRLNLESTETQSHQFNFGPSGLYVLRYEIDLRHGPGSSPYSSKLAGIVSIYDATHELKLRESFEEQIGPNQVGGELIRIESDAVAGRNPHTLSIELAPLTSVFLQRYTDLQVWLKRQPAHPMMY